MFRNVRHRFSLICFWILSHYQQPQPFVLLTLIFPLLPKSIVTKSKTGIHFGNPYRATLLRHWMLEGLQTTSALPWQKYRPFTQPCDDFGGRKDGGLQKSFKLRVDSRFPRTLDVSFWIAWFDSCRSGSVNLASSASCDL